MNSKNKLKAPKIDDKKVWDIIAGLVGYQAFLVAYDLGLFSFLNQGPKSFIEITKNLGIKERPTEAILSTCLNLDFIKQNNSQYELTEVSKIYLVNSSPFFFGAAYDLIINNFMNYKDIKKALLTDKPIAYGEENIFEAHEKQDELAKNFTRAMHSASMAPALYWPEIVDLSGCKKFLDVGGGSGAHTIGALLKWNHLFGIVLEIEPVCEVCEELFIEYKLKERAKTHIGDFWNCQYPESDVHFYSQIFHDWPKDKCEYLSKKSFSSLPKGGKIIIHEILMDDDKSGPFMAAAASVAMVGWTEGKQYSGNELESILIDAGFSSIEIMPALGYWSTVIGTK